MATYREERRANKDYICTGCGQRIEKGSSYICITEHSTSSIPVSNSKKLYYYGTQYYNTQHYSDVKQYHKECE